METGKTLTVALDFGRQDLALLPYVRSALGTGAYSRLTLVCVHESLGHLEQMVVRLPQLGELPSEAQAAEAYLEQVREVLSNEGVPIEVHVREGDAWREILEHSVRAWADLLIFPGSIGQSASARIVRKAPCSVWMIPEGGGALNGPVVVPVDFSARCREALKAALDWRGLNHDAPIVVLFTYRLPPAVVDNVSERESLARALEDEFMTRLEEYVAPLIGDAGEQVTLRVEQVVEETGSAICTIAEEMGSQGIVMASRAHSSIAVLTLGSVTESVVAQSTLPVLCIKLKGETASLLESIFELPSKE